MEGMWNVYAMEGHKWINMDVGSDFHSALEMEPQHTKNLVHSFVFTSMVFFVHLRGVISKNKSSEWNNMAMRKSPRVIHWVTRFCVNHVKGESCFVPTNQVEKSRYIQYALRTFISLVYLSNSSILIWWWKNIFRARDKIANINKRKLVRWKKPRHEPRKVFQYFLRMFFLLSQCGNA